MNAKLSQFLVRAGTDDDLHEKQLNKTGFWGKHGAGCIVVCPSTKRILLGRRGKDVEQPLEWGGFGGAIDSLEPPKKAALRELREETGFKGKAELLPLFKYRAPGFTYFNYLALVDTEYKPKLDWETSSARWFVWDHLPSPLHFGFLAVLQNSKSKSILLEYLK